MNKVFLIFLFSLFLIVSCKNKEQEEQSKEIFKITSPMQKDTTINKEYVCQIHAFEHIELRSLEKGYLQKILVDEGQYVKKGQLLFQIQPTIYQAEMQKAQSEVEFAKVEYENAKALADKEIVSKNEVALAKAKLEKAKAELTYAKTELSFTEVRAPFNGIVGKFKDVRLGSLLDEGALLTTLSDVSKMWVYFNVPEAEYLNYSMQKKKNKEHVHLRLANNLLFPKDGVIETIESDFNNTTGNIAFRATFLNPSGLLRHGQTGTILWPRELKAVTLVPQKATFEVLDKKFVFLVDPKGKVKSKEIKIADELDHIYIVKSGLKLDDKFLLEGLRKVQSGESIKFIFINPQQVFANLSLYAE